MRKVNQHHTVPTSRGGGSDDVTLWDEKFHEYFHYIFLNMKPDEQHKFLDEINKPNGYWSIKELNKIRKDIIRGRK